MDSTNGSPPSWTSHRGQGQFASVVGEFENEVVLNGGNSEPHARFRVNAGGQTYEADINVHSLENPDGSPGGSEVQYAIKDVVVSSMPSDGVQMGGNESYAGDGLQPGDFKTVADDELHQQLIQLAKASSRIELLGQVYSDGPGKNGIHDIHMNSGDPTRRDAPDGLVRFYVNEGGQIHQKTVYIKFQSQHFPSQTYKIQA